MATQSGLIADRLERLEAGDHLAQFDSKVRFLKTDSIGAILPRKTEAEDQVARLISLMEDLAKRMDGLDRKNRGIAEEFRQRDRLGRKRRRSIAVTAAVLATLAIGFGAKAHFDRPVAAAMAID